MSFELPSSGSDMSLVVEMTEYPLEYRVLPEPILYLTGLSKLWSHHPAIPKIAVGGRAMGLRGYLRDGHKNGSFTPNPPDTAAVPLKDFTNEIAIAPEGADFVEGDSDPPSDNEVAASHPTSGVDNYVPFGTTVAPEKEKGSLLVMLPLTHRFHRPMRRVLALLLPIVPILIHLDAT
uniref:uncharacterized protein LOC122602232 n=1 Tax=Erigeron canadensis TaxID=72917 RepID=UPI001CB90861|nr:uncharacterized protein LOC122602232 [Erigeron canadensis]